jgi:hypothetical protein
LEVTEEYKARASDHGDASAAELLPHVTDLIAIATSIVPYYMAHNAEADACDLLMEVFTILNKKEARCLMSL